MIFQHQHFFIQFHELIVNLLLTKEWDEILFILLKKLTYCFVDRFQDRKTQPPVVAMRSCNMQWVHREDVLRRLSRVLRGDRSKTRRAVHPASQHLHVRSGEERRSDVQCQAPQFRPPVSKNTKEWFGGNRERYLIICQLMRFKFSFIV